MKIADLTVNDFIINNRIIEQPIILDISMKMKFYSSYEEVMEDLDLLRIVGHCNNQNRGDENFPVFKTTKSIVHRTISSSSNVAYMGRSGPANLILIGSKIAEAFYEHDVFYRFAMEGKIEIIDKFDPYEVLCCRLFEKDFSVKHPLNPFYQFSGFTGIMTSDVKAIERDDKIDEILDINEIVKPEKFLDKIKNILNRW